MPPNCSRSGLLLRSIEELFSNTRISSNTRQACSTLANVHASMRSTPGSTRAMSIDVHSRVPGWPVRSIRGYQLFQRQYSSLPQLEQSSEETSTFSEYDSASQTLDSCTHRSSFSPLSPLQVTRAKFDTMAAPTMSKVLWTKDDDKILGALYKLKTPIDQIQIYIPHQPLKVIEARVKALDEGVEPAAIKTKAGKSRTSRSNTKPTFQRWTPEEDRILKQAVTEIGVGRWGDVSKLYFSPESATLGMAPENASTATQGSTNQERSPRACQIRWNFLNPQSAFLQGAWSADEIELFQELVSPDGVNDWEEISRAIGTRSPLQCHSQFKTVMHSGKKGKWTMEEIRLLQEAVQLYNRDWQKVAAHVGTRAPGQVRQKANNMSEDVVRRLKTRTQQTTDEP